MLLDTKKQLQELLKNVAKSVQAKGLKIYNTLDSPYSVRECAFVLSLWGL